MSCCTVQDVDLIVYDVQDRFAGIRYIQVVGNFVDERRQGWRGLVALTPEGADIAWSCTFLSNLPNLT